MLVPSGRLAAFCAVAFALVNSYPEGLSDDGLAAIAHYAPDSRELVTLEVHQPFVPDWQAVVAGLDCDAAAAALAPDDRDGARSVS